MLTKVLSIVACSGRARAEPDSVALAACRGPGLRSVPPTIVYEVSCTTSDLSVMGVNGIPCKFGSRVSVTESAESNPAGNLPCLAQRSVYTCSVTE
jgi:hypothetical protein